MDAKKSLGRELQQTFVWGIKHKNSGLHQFQRFCKNEGSKRSKNSEINLKESTVQKFIEKMNAQCFKPVK